MAITRQRRPAPPQSAPAGVGPVPITEPAPRRARRPVLAVAGIAVAAVGALGAYTMVNQAGDRVAVLAVAHAVAKGQVVQASDLTTAQVAPDPALKTVAVGRSSTIVGKTAATDLAVGMLVTPGSVTAGVDVTAGKSVVGVLAKPGMIPAGRLAPGQAVSVVQTPARTGRPPRAARHR
ncbi:SAF domain-containing protein [Streptacidiphilus monticola]